MKKRPRDGIVKMTRKGRKAARNATGVHALIIEVAMRTNNITEEHLGNLAAQLLDHYGDADDAVDALRRGDVVLEKLS